MTIGPEPRIRILWRSSRRGTGQLPDEVVEEADRVVRAGPGLGVVLDAAGRDVEQADALDRAVVEVDVRELGLAEVALQALTGLSTHREPVVLRGDGDPSRAQVLHGVVGPAVAERQLEGLKADGAREQLVAEADPEDGLAPDQPAD